MTEQTVNPPPAPPGTPSASPSAPPTALKERRTFGLPAAAAIASATLLIGGLAGGIIGYAVHPDRPDFADRPGFGQQLRPGGPGRQLPPAQEDDSADQVPDGE